VSVEGPANLNVSGPWYGGYYEASGARFAGMELAGDMRVTPTAPGNAPWP